jgi:hypothetical protein
MLDEPKTTNTQDLADVEYDAERRARLGAGQGLDPKKAVPTSAVTPEVGIAQKGPDEDAVVKRVTDV